MNTVFLEKAIVSSSEIVKATPNFMLPLGQLDTPNIPSVFLVMHFNPVLVAFAYGTHALPNAFSRIVFLLLNKLPD